MVQRITQQMIANNNLGHIQARQSDLFKRQQQISSGLRYEKASEDTISAANAMNLKTALAFQKRVDLNAQLAQDFNNASDTQLGSAADVLNRARELASRAATETLNEQQLNGLTSELNGLIDRLADIGNSTQEGTYIFGGFQTQQPPFVSEKNLVLSGTNLADLGLSQGTHRTRVETHSISTAQAGAFALNGGDLIINHVDIGSLTVNDPTRTAAQNAQTYVDLINAKTAQTGVRAVAITIPGGTYAAPGAGPFTGVALTNLDANGVPTAKGIEVSGRGIPGAGGLNLFRNENLSLSDTRYTSERVGAGAIGDVAANTVQINGINIASPMTFAAANTPEQNAQEIARAINTISGQTQVYASTDGNGFVQLSSQKSFTIGGAPAQLQLPNQDYEQLRDTPASTAAISAGAALRLGSGSLILNGVDIFAQELVLDAGMTAPERAQAVARAINAHGENLGISAYADASGRLRFSNADRHITAVAYRGDSGENQTQIGQASLVQLNMSGDKAFAGNRNSLNLLSSFDLPAAGLGTAFSAAGGAATNVSFNAGDTLGAGSFVINGTSILAGPMTGVAATDANTLIAAINAQTGTTNVSAALSGTGGIQLTSSTGNAFTLATAGAGTRANVAAATYLNPLGTGAFLINGVDIGPIPNLPPNPGNPTQNMLDLGNALAAAINAKSAQTAVTAQVQTQSSGGVRLLFTTQGQDIDITSNSLQPNTLLSATGIAPGTHVDQRIDAFEALIRLRDQVLTSKFSRNPAVTISTQNMKEISDALDRLNDNRVELGTRSQRAELVSNRVKLTQETLKSQLSVNQEIDITAAISQMTNEQTALEAAYKVTQMVSGLSLLNFI